MSKLFEKTQIGSMKLKNRIVMGPMGTTGEADGAYNIDAINYFMERAKGGTGLIITGANVVSTKYEPRPCTELSNFHHVERLNMLIDRCHHFGAKVCVQLSPGLGRQQFTDPFTPPYSAGDCPAFWFPQLKCKPFAVEDIHYLADKVGYSASLAKMSGADAVELHAYGGYLLDQFQSSKWNTRTDEYGGSLENRMRFTLECIQAIRSNVGPDFPILVKFTPYHGVEGGRELDEGLEMAKILENAGIDALHVDVGCYEAWYKAISTVYAPEGHQLHIVEAVKNTVSLPVLGQGKLFDPEKAEEVIENGIADYVVLAHQMLADPHWANKVKEGAIEDITPCVGCNECLLAGFSGKHYYCAVNPQCYAEKEYALPKPDGTSKKVLVIGGGPGGMSAAMTAAKRGYEVELWEKTGRLGGNLWAAGTPTFKHDVLRLITYMERQIHKLGVNVRLLKEATAEEVAAGQFDKVILAAGSTPVMPPIPGIEYAASANAYLTAQKKPGKKVVVIGGGLVGCEAAAYMKETADEVTIIEMLDDILATADHCLNNDQALRAMLAERNIPAICSAKVTRITPDSVTYVKDGKEASIDCDTVMIAAGYRANNQLEEALEGFVKDLTVIGDAEAPRKILTAVHEGYHAIRVME
ncbi:NAD(P)/FAD-dependent oxidoreductase [Diplocloster agilis]|uniref:NAD(P)/FAD-dependent oxidoreductase n=1 Tax=Diplocloster agilis TaxID=2850323 RepID=UPI000821067E|nr:NAD(P)/FAD-dependent oxidoreductase [Suonthocola fibrivorans]MCU6735097.1 NAD(P)/FAD-dependent oxidoreductase [Suonthocola fibrivorans]SCJ63893.1 NADH oxidase [uncultured Clostridium sp.]